VGMELDIVPLITRKNKATPAVVACGSEVFSQVQAFGSVRASVGNELLCHVENLKRGQ
jgi:hypothetical protein